MGGSWAGVYFEKIQRMSFMKDGAWASLSSEQAGPIPATLMMKALLRMAWVYSVIMMLRTLDILGIP